MRRDARWLDVATTLFRKRGFDGTSIDGVAEAAGVSKPTVYARYHDKRDLFAPVLRERIRLWLAPLSTAAEAQATEASLESITPKRSRRLCTSLAGTCSHLRWGWRQARCSGVFRRRPSSFPELAKLAHEEGWLRAVRAVASLLRRPAARGQIK